MANMTDTQATQPGQADTQSTSPIDYVSAAKEAFNYIKPEDNVNDVESQKSVNEDIKSAKKRVESNPYSKGNLAKVAVVNTLNSLAFGVPKPIAMAIAKKINPERLKEYQAAEQANPGAVAGGEAVGFLPSLLAGPGSVAAKGVAKLAGKAGIKAAGERFAPEAISGAAKAAQDYLNFGNVAGKKVAEMLPQNAPKLLKSIVEQGTAGAAYTAPETIARTATGEENLSDAGKQMLVGTGVGTVLGIASPLLQKVLSKLPKRVAQGELMEGGLSKAGVQALGKKGPNAVEETAEKFKNVMKSADNDYEKASKIAAENADKTAKEFFEPLKKTGYTPENFEPYIKQAVADHALMPEQEAIFNRKLLGAENKDPVVLSKRLTDLNNSFKGQNDALAAINDLRKKFDESVLNHLDTVQEKRPGMKMGVYQDYLKNYAQDRTVMDMIEAQNAAVKPSIVGGSPTPEKQGIGKFAGALIGGGAGAGEGVAEGIGTEEGIDPATILKRTIIGSIGGNLLMRGEKAGTGLLAKGIKRATPLIEDVLKGGAGAKVGGKIATAMAPAEEGKIATPQTTAEAQTQNEVQAPVKIKQWYENPKGAQTLVNILHNKYQDALARGIIDSSISEDDYINEVHNITGGFNPRMLAKVFYPDEEQRKVFLEQLDEHEEVQAAKQRLADSGVDIKEIAKINPIENMFNQGAIAAQKEALIDEIAKLSGRKKGGGESTGRFTMKKIERDVNGILNNRLITPEVKAKRLEKLMEGGSKTLLTNVGIV